MLQSGLPEPESPRPSPLSRRMWIFAGILLLIAIGAIGGIFVAGARVGWDMEAQVTNGSGRGGALTLSQGIIAFTIFGIVCLVGAVAAARQAVRLRP